MSERKRTSDGTSDTSAAAAKKADRSARTASRAGRSDTQPTTGAHPEQSGMVVDRRSGIDRRDLEALQAKFGHSEAGHTNAGQPNAGQTGATDVPSPTAASPRSAASSGAATGLERRRGPGRRLSDFTRAAEEGELTQEQFLFIMAIEEFKRANDKQFPTWSDVLEVIRLLGYRKTMASELSLRSAEDWRESPISPSNVRAPRWAEHILVDAARERLREESTREKHEDGSIRRAA